MKFANVLLFAATALAVANTEAEVDATGLAVEDIQFDLTGIEGEGEGDVGAFDFDEATAEIDSAGIEKRTPQGIVAAARRQLGKKYVWGGGGCNGPSKGGFDCSGLTQYAVCQGERKTIPRTAQTQYNSKLGRRIPRGQAKPGDLIFWANGGNCGSKVNHVGVISKPGWMINAPRTGIPVREQKIWTKSGSQSICPSAMRFW